MKSLTYLTVLAGAVLAPLHGGNIVLNPGFETGDFTSWTTTLADNGTDLRAEGPSNTGRFAAAFGATDPGHYDAISQSFDTVNGQTYTLSFFLNGSYPNPTVLGSQLARALDVPVDAVGDFQAFWDNQMILDTSAGNTPSFDFTQFSFNEVGTGNDTITFRGYNVPDHYFLDDVSVETAAPEPSTWGLIGAGLVVFAAARKGRRSIR